MTGPQAAVLPPSPPPTPQVRLQTQSLPAELGVCASCAADTWDSSSSLEVRPRGRRLWEPFMVVSPEVPAGPRGAKGGPEMLAEMPAPVRGGDLVDTAGLTHTRPACRVSKCVRPRLCQHIPGHGEQTEKHRDVLWEF